MTRRICLTAAAITAGALALSVGSASAAKSKTHKTPPPKPVPVSASCKLKVTGVAAANQDSFSLASDSGDLFGATSCPGPEGKGLAHLNFTLEDNGDLDGSFWEYFGDGSVHGTYVLSPSAPPTLTIGSFTSQDFTGTLEVTGGSGPFAPATGKGTLTCTSPDSVRMSCTAAFKFTELTAPVVPAATTKKR